jgi:hypothetical protein
MRLQCSHLKRDCLADKKKHPELKEKIPARHTRKDENALFLVIIFQSLKCRVFENRKLNTKIWGF